MFQHDNKDNNNPSKVNGF